jgi:hypothetical protein
MYSGPPFAVDVMAEIEKDAKRLQEASDPDAEFARMLQETAVYDEDGNGIVCDCGGCKERRGW